MDVKDNNAQMKQMEALKSEYMDYKMSNQQVEALKQKIRQAKRARRRRYVVRTASAMAAVLAVFVVLPQTSDHLAYAMRRIPLLGRLVTVVVGDDFQYEDDHKHVDIKVPELALDQTDDGEQVLQRSVEEINKEISRITDQLIAEARENISQETGYEDITVTSEVLRTADNYFTLKLVCYRSLGSGAEWDYFYTIDLATGQRLRLSDLFTEDYDYISSISEDIKRQMRSQMEADENKIYWLDDPEMEVWNFETISEDVSFYINAQGKLVICFDEGDVAPMYMGTVEFVIDQPDILAILIYS